MTATKKTTNKLDISKPTYKIFLITRDDGFFDIKYREKYIVSKITEKEVILLTKPKGRSAIKTTFDARMSSLVPFANNIENLRKSILKQYNDNCLLSDPLPLDEIFEDDKKEDIFDVIQDTSFNDINPDKIEEIIAMVITEAKYYLKNPLWLFLLGASGIGKSYKLNFFEDDRVVHTTGRVTKNAFLSGKPNKETEDPYSILEEAKGKCIITNDVSQIIGSNEEDIRKKIGILTDQFGRIWAIIEDPAGRRKTPTGFTLIWGMTYLQYTIIRKYTTMMGDRFLVLHIPTDWEKCHFDQDDPNNEKQKNRKRLLISHIINTQNKYEQLPKYTPEMKKITVEFAKKVVLLRNFAWKTIKLTEIEHYQRLVNILLNCAVTRAMLWDREPTIEDAEFFFELAIPTIYRVDLFKKYFNENNESVFNDLEDKRKNPILINIDNILKEDDKLSMKDDWRIFFEKYIANYGDLKKKKTNE